MLMLKIVMCLLYAYLAFLLAFAVWLLIQLFIIVPRKEKQEEAAYLETDYYKATGHSRRSLLSSNGRKNEYDIFCELKDLPGSPRFLFNCWIPSVGSRPATELDVLILHPAGCFCVESKDYKGKIFGRASDEQWVQELGSSENPTINDFHNPIKQNHLHIKSLTAMFRNLEGKVFSYVVFSDRCSFDIPGEVPSGVVVTKTSRIRKRIEQRIQGPAILSREEIDLIYNRLLPCCKKVGAA